MQRPQGQQAREVTMSVETTEQIAWSGPLPDAATLERYDALVPGAAERIIAMAEKQSVHRREMEKIALTSGTRRAHQGLWLGFILVLVGMVSGAILIWNGRETEGFVLILGQLVLLASTFLYANLKKG